MNFPMIESVIFKPSGLIPRHRGVRQELVVSLFIAFRLNLHLQLWDVSISAAIVRLLQRRPHLLPSRPPLGRSHRSGNLPTRGKKQFTLVWVEIFHLNQFFFVFQQKT